MKKRDDKTAGLIYRYYNDSKRTTLHADKTKSSLLIKTFFPINFLKTNSYEWLAMQTGAEQFIYVFHIMNYNMITEKSNL